MSSSSLSAVTMARVETTSSRPYHLVIFGASGFTGQFVVEEVARTISEGPKGNLKWAVAGRSKQKLEKVLEQAAGVLSMYLVNPRKLSVLKQSVCRTVSPSTGLASEISCSSEVM